MKKLALFLISISFIACQNEKKSVNTVDSTSLAVDTELSFKYDSVKVYSKFPIVVEKVSDTSKAVISYPVFADEKINQFIQQKVLKAGNEGENYTSYLDFANSFIKNFDDFSKENKGYGQTWFMNGKVEVVAQQPHYLSLLFTFVNYEGGAHPNSSFVYLNYDPVNHQEIILDSLLNPGSMTKLTAVAENIFRKNEKLAPGVSLKDNYFFENDKFSLNQNFSVTKEGIKFLYNPYEIKAYAYGITELLIPFTALKDIAKPNGLLNPVN
ncbi:DUF3298 and DUF4163 domain-containing protein [Pedobacter nyackensis]|uniref:DUF3298 domain-containing protein n=1 Tax=Pedobacter nyackensis TaxID=475255 RepID=A0A1W2CPI8_9SPHI|nr:DUF3298 and DUF4163 domain-containing protein [Pedobacter nyackensis]SMC87167.1 Protein of unknown function [Pedobacter nyackensis]